MEPAKRQTDPSLTSGTMGNGQGTESWGYSRFHCQSFLMSKTHIFIHVFCVYTLCMDKFPQTDTGIYGIEFYRYLGLQMIFVQLM